jgi:ribonuclease HI
VKLINIFVLIAISKSGKGQSLPNMSYSRIQNGQYVVCFTDGACAGNGQAGAKAGIGVFFGQNNPWNISAPLHPGWPQTSNTAEIIAAITAVNVAHSHGEYLLEIHSDSEVMIKGITEWIHTWEVNGWRNGEGRPVVNMECFQALKEAISRMNHVQFVHVRGHQRDPGNEEANRLAQAGACM